MLFLDNDNKILKDVLDGRIGPKCVSCSFSLSFRVIPSFSGCSLHSFFALLPHTLRAARPVQPLEIRLCDFDGACVLSPIRCIGGVVW